MTQPSLNQEQLAELAGIVEAAKIAEKKTREMSVFGIRAIAQKY